MKKTFFFATFAMLTVVIAGCASQATQNNDNTTNLDKFTQCLTEK